jgi:hypothetical protein
MIISIIAMIVFFTVLIVRISVGEGNCVMPDDVQPQQFPVVMVTSA